jgi:broad specificity phosphatase PhoE
MKLILVKHAPPEITPNILAHRWTLSEEGRRRCDWLADELEAQGVSRIYSSLEPKALETAALVAVRLNLTVEPRQNLHENDRTGLGFVKHDQLQQRVRDFFDQPARIVLGTETADGALQRFADTVSDIVLHARGQNSAIVTHGTVLSLFVAHHTGIKSFSLWLRLGLPAYVILDAHSFLFDGKVHNHSGCADANP